MLYVMERDNRSKKYFENLLRSKHNHERVIRKNGNMYVDLNYESPLRIEVENLLFSALEIAKNPHDLATNLSNYSDVKSVNSIYLYLRYQSFKHHKRVIEIKYLLELFLHEHSKT